MHQKHQKPQVHNKKQLNVSGSVMDAQFNSHSASYFDTTTSLLTLSTFDVSWADNLQETDIYLSYARNYQTLVINHFSFLWTFFFFLLSSDNHKTLRNLLGSLSVFVWQIRNDLYKNSSASTFLTFLGTDEWKCTISVPVITVTFNRKIDINPSLFTVA